MILVKIITTLVLSLFFILLVIKFAVRFGLSDIPNRRSSHYIVMPRGAGIAFGLVFFLSIAFFEYDLFLRNWIIFLSIFIVYSIGIIDDFKEISAKVKFIYIFFATALLFFEDIIIYDLGTYFGYEISLWYLAMPFTLFAITGFTNALNLIDGLDGLSTSISIIILSSFGLIGYLHSDELITQIVFYTLPILVVFLYFNWNPAKVFMGDSGSLFLGFIISIVAVMSLKYIHPVAVFYLTAVPIVDTLIVMVRRYRLGQSPFSPDKTHIHHILLRFFGSRVKKAVFFLVLMQLLFSLVGLLLATNTTLGSGFIALVALVAFVGVTILFYLILTGMKKRQDVIGRFRKRRDKFVRRVREERRINGDRRKRDERRVNDRRKGDRRQNNDRRDNSERRVENKRRSDEQRRT